MWPGHRATSIQTGGKHDQLVLPRQDPATSASKRVDTQNPRLCDPPAIPVLVVGNVNRLWTLGESVLVASCGR